MTTQTLQALEHLGLDALRDLVDEAKEMADYPEANLDNEAIAGLAIELAAINAAVISALEPLKVRLRELARSSLPAGQNSGKVSLEGVGSVAFAPDTGPCRGRVTVTFPSPAPRVSKSTDVFALRARLGHAFDRYFEAKTTYKPRKGLGELVKGQEQAEIDSVMAAIEYTDPTPRVGFEYDAGFLRSPTTSDS